MKLRHTLSSQTLNFALAFGLCAAIFAEVNVLNHLPGEHLLTALRPGDVLIGLTIYLKTAVDFAILIGLLMRTYQGHRHARMIIAGTAIGNAGGTAAILALWYFFKEVHWLLAIMVVLASLVLLKLAETSLEHIENDDPDVRSWHLTAKRGINSILLPINKVLRPLLSRIVPDMQLNDAAKLGLFGLFLLSLKIPFILGLDDFAGYVPLFNVVNVLGFSIGVIVGHAILCSLLFLSPKHTIRLVKNPVISLLGSLAFVGLAGFGLFEVAKLLLR